MGCYEVPLARVLECVMRKETTRRAAIVTGGSALVGTIGLSAVDNQASANITGEFTIPDSTKVLTDETLTDIRLGCDADLTWSSNAPINAYEVRLSVGPNTTSLQEIANTSKDDLGMDEYNESIELGGSLTNGAFTIDDFQPTEGELRRSVIAELYLKTTRNGETVVEDTHTTSFTVTMRNEQLQIDAGLNAGGEVTISTE